MCRRSFCEWLKAFCAWHFFVSPQTYLSCSANRQLPVVRRSEAESESCCCCCCCCCCCYCWCFLFTRCQVPDTDVDGFCVYYFVHRSSRTSVTVLAEFFHIVFDKQLQIVKCPRVCTRMKYEHWVLFVLDSF